MIQFNLLPDIKIQYLKAKRQKHLVMFVSTIVTCVSLAIFIVLLVVVHVVQKKSINDLSGDIKVASDELQGTQDLTKILTVQNQLKSLPSLHDQKAVASRIFSYMSQVTPTDMTIGKLDIDFAQNTMTIAGNASGLNTVNKYIDTLKFTTFKTDSTEQDTNAFSEVVLTAFGRDSEKTTYTIDLKFDPIIFSNTEEVTLTVPNIISTRSEVEKPTALFQGSGQ